MTHYDDMYAYLKELRTVAAQCEQELMVLTRDGVSFRIENGEGRVTVGPAGEVKAVELDHAAIADLPEDVLSAHVLRALKAAGRVAVIRRIEIMKRYERVSG